MSGPLRYRLLAVDLDGTLLTSDRTVSDEDAGALRKAASAGCRIAIVTGRRFPAVRRCLEPLGVAVYVVANSGAIIREGLDGRILLRRLLPLGTALRVLELAELSGMEPVIHNGPDAEGHLVLRTTARNLPSMGRYLNQSHPPPSWVSTLRLERPPVQIGFTGTVTEIRSFESTLAEGLCRSAHLASFGRTEYPDEDLSLLDVLSPEATKSRAVRFLASLLGVGMESTMAIGDNWNDLEMLRSAGRGVLMANAVPELQRLGFAETRSNDDGGVAFAVSRYVFGSSEEKGTKKRG